MTALTDRYLGVVLDAVPGPQRSDIERELRSSIGDALDDRIAAGETPERAETEVLEGLGDPTSLATRLTGRPTSLIGPELFQPWRQVVSALLVIVVPLFGGLLAIIALTSGEGILGALGAGIGGAIQAVVHIAFWVTVVFALVERYGTSRDPRAALGLPSGRWTVGRLPAPMTARMSASDLVTELLTSILCIGGLVVLAQVQVTVDGHTVPLLAADFREPWLPFLVLVLAALAALQVVVYAAGRWTMRLALVHAGIQLAFTVPVVILALQGRIIDPAFAQEVGWPALAAGDGVAMASVAVVVTLVTAWDILDAFRKARRVA